MYPRIPSEILTLLLKWSGASTVQQLRKALDSVYVKRGGTARTAYASRRLKGYAREARKKTQDSLAGLVTPGEASTYSATQHIKENAMDDMPPGIKLLVRQYSRLAPRAIPNASKLPPLTQGVLGANYAHKTQKAETPENVVRVLMNLIGRTKRRV